MMAFTNNINLAIFSSEIITFKAGWPMINSLKDQIYDALRNFVFSIMYPAPSIFNPRSKNYIGVRALANHIINADASRNLMYFDLEGNLYTFDSYKNLSQPGIFEAILIKNIQKDGLYNNDMQYIIFVGGNTTCSEILLPEMIDCYNKNHKQICVIGFNPPGVGMSPGVATFETNCDALSSIIKHLLGHIPAENILIIGHSLGGSIGSIIAAKYQLLGNNIRVFIDRAMSSISDAAVAKVMRSIPTALLRNTIGLLLALITKVIIKALHLEIDVVTNFVLINAKNLGSARAMAASGDEIMDSCCLVNKIPVLYKEHSEQFDLDPCEKNRKSHSVQHNLLFSKKETHKTAEHYLRTFIEAFPIGNNKSKNFIPSCV